MQRHILHVRPLRWEQRDAGDDHGEREKGDHANAASPRHDAQGTLPNASWSPAGLIHFFFFSFVERSSFFVSARNSYTITYARDFLRERRTHVITERSSRDDGRLRRISILGEDLALHEPK